MVHEAARTRALFAGTVMLIISICAACVEPPDVSAPPPPPAPSVPNPTAVPSPAVSGGGPLPGDISAKNRIAALLPSFPDDIQIEGVDAISYAETVAQFIPAVAPAFRGFKVSVDCAIAHGVAAARVYVTRDLRRASAILILSKGQLMRAPQIAAQCFVSEVLGGGSSVWNPCAMSYGFSAVVEGVQDEYSVLIVSTGQACEIIAEGHQRFSPVPIR